MSLPPESVQVSPARRQQLTSPPPKTDRRAPLPTHCSGAPASRLQFSLLSKLFAEAKMEQLELCPLT